MAEDFCECPICELRLPVGTLERHVNTHLDEAECAKDYALAWKIARTSQSSSQIQAEDYSKGYERDGTECKAEDMERENCKKQKVQASHSEKDTLWTNTVPNNRLDAESIMATQRKGTFKFVDKGLMYLLRDCLNAENHRFSCTVISGHIDHFESSASEDIGWGCGWRNIQMLSSHLLRQNWGAKAALYGGAGFVPDIPSLQTWLESAWANGFDEPGAEFYNHAIHGSKEWIGTTECAALFRSFGLRACMVDFSSAGNIKKYGQTSIDKWLLGCSSKSIQDRRKETYEVLKNTEIHYDVECDLCGEYPIIGPRFKSRKETNYDLCSACLYSGAEKPDDYEKVETFSIPHDSFKGNEVAGDEDVNHESLVSWVWNYFIGGIKDSSLRACMNRFQGHIATSECTPLYFQHQGHSRTIVGMQRRRKNTAAKEEVFLLVLDPSIKTEELARALKEKGKWQRLIKRGVHTLKKRSYQVCYIEPGIARGEELEQLKALTSTQFSY